MPREFKNRIFLGRGAWSEAECKRLHKRLDEALNSLRGPQQPSLEPLSAFLDYYRDLADCQVATRLAAEDIVCALLGPKARVEIDP